MLLSFCRYSSESSPNKTIFTFGIYLLIAAIFIHAALCQMQKHFFEYKNGFFQLQTRPRSHNIFLLERKGYRRSACCK